MGQKRQKLFTDSDFSEKFCFRLCHHCYDYFYWMWITWILLGFALESKIFGCKRIKQFWDEHERCGEKFAWKIEKEEEKVRLIELRLSSSSTVVVTPFLVSIPLQYSFDSKSIICLCFLNDTNGKNAFSFYPHSSLPTWDPWNPFHSLWCYDYGLPSVRLISKRACFGIKGLLKFVTGQQKKKELLWVNKKAIRNKKRTKRSKENETDCIN